MRRRRVGTQDYCVVDDLAGLLALLNAGTIELHPLLSRGERADIPTAVVFDLDPGPPAGLAECARVAAALAERLRSEGLVPAAKTSGSLGLHVHAAVSPASFAETKELARSLARELAGARPDLVVARQERAARVGKVLVDWGQNAPTRSLPAPYSLRAREAPSVSTPVTWDELESDPAGLAFGPRDVLERVSRLGDVFAPLASS
ncbi:MAG: hypothetical protein ICV74_08930 [Thermoleophilia bacterium]|nr:hypothetical protein [Thermoleophilia bacterium]